jgi:hypothetical protein
MRNTKMDSPDKRPNLFIREIPLIVLLVFWVVYAGIEIIRGRLDILTSVIPTGLFILAYVIVRLTSKEQKGGD